MFREICESSCGGRHGGTSFGLGDLLVNLDRYEVTIAGNRVRLRPQEYTLLAFLALHPDKIHPYESVRRLLFGKGAEIDQTTNGAIRVVISRIRKALSAASTDGNAPSLETRYGIGCGLLMPSVAMAAA